MKPLFRNQGLAVVVPYERALFLWPLTLFLVIALFLNIAEIQVTSQWHVLKCLLLPILFATNVFFHPVSEWKAAFFLAVCLSASSVAKCIWRFEPCEVMAWWCLATVVVLVYCSCVFFRQMFIHHPPRLGIPG